MFHGATLSLVRCNIGGIEMTMNQNSIDAYAHIKKLNKKQNIVYEAIRANPVSSNRELADDVLHWRINCVTGRVNELKDARLIIIAGKKRDPLTHRTVDFYEVT